MAKKIKKGKTTQNRGTTVGVNVGGKTRIVKRGSNAYNKYMGQGGTKVSTSAEKKARDAQRAFSTERNRNRNNPNYVDPLENPMSAEMPTPEVETGIPSPFTANATPFTQAQSQVGGAPSPIPQSPASGGQVTYEQATQNLNAGGLQGQQLAQAQQMLKQKYQGGLQNAQASGMQAPLDGAEARAMTSSFLPSQGELMPSPTDTMFNMDGTGDPYMSGLIQMFQQQFSPENQKASLAQEYDKMYKKAGLEKLDTEIMNTKNIIEGTEDDIRNEVTKAGGFATDSQVAALTNARNKSLIKNYDNLVSMRDSAEQRLNTMVNLTIQDRQMADQKFNQMMNFGMQIADYKNKMQQNAISQFQWLASQPGGFEAIEAATATSPYYQGLVNKVFGGADGLATLSAKAKEAGAYDKKIKDLEYQKLYNDVYGAKSRNTSWQDINGQRVLVDDDTGEIINNPAGTQGGNTDKLQMTSDLLDTLSKDVQMTNAIGPNRVSRWDIGSWFTGAKQNFIGGVETLTAGQTLDAVLKLKKAGGTLGALNEKEGGWLQASASKIDNWAIKNDEGKVIGYNASKKDFKEELYRINALTKKALVESGRDPISLGVQIMPNGRYVVRNYDGTYYEI